MTTATMATTSDVARDFRHALRRLAATVTIVTTADASGRRHGMTATAVNPVTMDPPTLLICVNHGASIHAPLLEARRFCVNVLTTGHGDLVAAFSGHKAGEDRFTAGAWHRSDAGGTPFLEDAQSNLFCDIESVTAVGTHSVILARVVEARAAEEIAPLIYTDGRLGALAAHA
jgi:flavin reductase (DIM6/NTAB) family NADH-FMN oxidoreductase RutF